MFLFLGPLMNLLECWRAQAFKLIILVISNRPPTPVDTTGAATFESEEVLLPGSEIVIDIDDLTSLQTQVGADPYGRCNTNFYSIRA